MPEPVSDAPKVDERVNEEGENLEKDEKTTEKSAENEDVVCKAKVKMAPHDVMRNEPILTNLIVENYEGEKDERGFFHGVGTAYFKGGHVYTGSFVNGKMSGLGKYVWSNGIIYEGEFKENRIEGNGKYTWLDNSVYEGEVFNGLRHGQGTFYCGCLPSVYTGEWNHGKRHGRGHLRYNEEGKSEYDGHWFNNNRHGHGMRRYASGNEYNGEWKDNQRHGDGVMHWTDREQLQTYKGQWEYGMQHGHGEHSWYLKRIPGSQYPLRNYYVGDWCNGLRQGYGTFTYASGAKYIGEWMNNMKHGKGMYIFKNGHLFEGNFEQDHMIDFPEFNPSGMTTPDIANSGIPMQPLTPLRSATPFIPTDSSNLGINNPLSIKIDHLFDDLEMYLDERQEELQGVTHVILRHMSKLKQIYSFYSGLGQEYSTDNTFAMTQMQFWRFLKDCKIHHHGVTLVEMDRFVSTNERTPDIHEPQHKVLLRDFVNAIITIGYYIFHGQTHKKGAVFAECTSKIMSQNILDNACNVQGSLFPSATKAEEATKYIEKSWNIFNSLCVPHKLAPYEPAFKARQFLFMLNEFTLFNNALTPKEVIEILSKDNPHLAQADFCNLELEITFLEFFEGLIDCALVYVSDRMIRSSDSAKLSPDAASIRSRSAECFSPLTSKPGESPEEDEENVVESVNGSPVASPVRSSHPGLSDSPEQKPATRESVIKTREGLAKEGKTPDASQQPGSQEETKRIASQHSTANMQQSASKTATAESETAGAGLGAVQENDADEEDQSPSPEVIPSSPQLDHQSTNVWATQLNIFFDKFFSAADRLEMIKKATQKNLMGNVKKLY